MLWANDNSGFRIAPTPGAQAVCPGCGGVVRAHCGEIYETHWHHESTAQCDSWHEPETPWHRFWKSHFKEDEQEVWRTGHRADVLTEYGVIEFQHSPISPEVIREREAFWDRLNWVFDARKWFSNFEIRPAARKTTFRWKHPHRSLAHARRPIYLDTGEELFQIFFIGSGNACGGSGQFVPYRYLHTALDYTGIR